MAGLGGGENRRRTKENYSEKEINKRNEFISPLMQRKLNY